MRRVPKATLIADFLHKGFVTACMAITVTGTGYLVYRFYDYITVVKPQFVEKQKLEQQKLLAEGSFENLKDPAQDLRT